MFKKLQLTALILCLVILSSVPSWAGQENLPVAVDRLSDILIPQGQNKTRAIGHVNDAKAILEAVSVAGGNELTVKITVPGPNNSIEASETFKIGKDDYYNKLVEFIGGSTRTIIQVERTGSYNEEESLKRIIVVQDEEGVVSVTIQQKGWVFFEDGLTLSFR